MLPTPQRTNIAQNLEESFTSVFCRLWPSVSMIRLSAIMYPEIHPSYPGSISSHSYSQDISSVHTPRNQRPSSENRQHFTERLTDRGATAVLSNETLYGFTLNNNYSAPKAVACVCSGVLTVDHASAAGLYTTSTYYIADQLLRMPVYSAAFPTTDLGTKLPISFHLF